MTDSAPVRRNVFVRCFRWLISRPDALWARIRPNPRVLRAISMATFFAVVALGGYAGKRMNLSSDVRVLLGHDGPPLSGPARLWFDLGAGALFAALIALLAWPAFALAMRLGKWLPTAIGRLGLGALLAGAFVLSDVAGSLSLGLLLAVVAALLIGCTIGGFAAWSGPRFAERRWFGKLTVFGFAVLGVAGIGAVVMGAMDEGEDSHLTKFPVYAAEADPAPLQAADPGAPGPFAGKVRYLTYGSGTDLHREEFAAGAAIKTEPVNGKPFAELPKGRAGKKRKLFWQFSMAKLPRNGRVWYPDGEGPFPLVLIVHGNHSMREFSDTGYEYLGEHLASHGYILCSVDQNFLNGNMRKENDARGWLLLEHLKLFTAWNAEAGNVFEGKVDLERISLMGHSRGGEAVTHAALFNRLKRYPEDASVTFDYGFSIRSIVSIAPVDGQYKPASRYAPVEDVSYLTLHGSHDADVTQFQGDRIYQRVALREGSDQFKASVYVYRANHGQFNTVWGATDHGPPRSLLLNRAVLLDGDAQRQIGRVFITAFLAATLRGDRSYQPMFGNARYGREWLPEAAITTRYEDASFQVIADFEEDVDVTSATVDGGTIRSEGLVVHREADIALRGSGRWSKRGNHGAFLGWLGDDDDDEEAEKEGGSEAPAPQPIYEIGLPEGFAAGLGDLGDKQLVLHLAEVDEKPKAKDYSEDDDAADEESEDEESTDGDKDQDEGDDDDDDEEDGDDVAEPELAVSVQLLTADGSSELPLSRYGRLLPPLEAVTTRVPFLTDPPPKTEITLQVFALPLADFVAQQNGFDLASVTGIRLTFGRGRGGVVVVDRIGIADRPN